MPRIKFTFLILGLTFLLASCETATQNALKSDTSATTVKSNAVSKSTGSLFGKATQTPSDKLIAVGDRVLFDYDSSELTSEAKLTLDKQSRFLRVNSDLTFTIEGHCDERGTREYNLALGEKRATAVRDYLVIEGISPDRIRVISYGKEKPAVIGSNDMAWSKNRRAVTTID